MLRIDIAAGQHNGGSLVGADFSGQNCCQCCGAAGFEYQPQFGEGKALCRANFRFADPGPFAAPVFQDGEVDWIRGEGLEGVASGRGRVLADIADFPSLQAATEIVPSLGLDRHDFGVGAGEG